MRLMVIWFSKRIWFSKCALVKFAKFSPLTTLNWTRTKLDMQWAENCGTPRGVLELFFDGVCGLRLKPLPISKDFSPSKNGWFYVFFFEIFVNWDPFLRVFLPQKWLILQFFRNFCEIWPSSKDFFDQNGTHV